MNITLRQSPSLMARSPLRSLSNYNGDNSQQIWHKILTIQVNLYFFTVMTFDLQDQTNLPFMVQASPHLFRESLSIINTILFRTDFVVTDKPKQVRSHCFKVAHVRQPCRQFRDKNQFLRSFFTYERYKSRMIT